MRVAVIGTGYVGVVTGVSAALDGHDVVCLDIVDEKVQSLNSGKAPFYEPGLDAVIKKLVKAGKLRASTSVVSEVARSDISFICVGTPSKKDGTADLSYIKAAGKAIGKALKKHKGYHVVVMKSTVPPGTTHNTLVPILVTYSDRLPITFGVCMNPEFLREGSALADAAKPDRIVIGELNARSGKVLLEFYKKKKCPILRMNLTAAEMVKYVSNSFLATKIAFSNEMANLCDQFGIEVYDVMEAVGLDYRINPHFLRAGAGFGGSCFPKDVSALAKVAKRANVRTRILEAVLHQNEEQPLRVIDMAEHELGSLSGKEIAILGLTFKPGTDDVRFSRAAPMIEGLLVMGAHVTVYDPKGMDNFKKEFHFDIKYAKDPQDALLDKDAVIFQTEWPEFRKIPATWYAKLMRRPLVIDGRRTVDPAKLHKEGVKYLAIGAGNQ